METSEFEKFSPPNFSPRSASLEPAKLESEMDTAEASEFENFSPPNFSPPPIHKPVSKTTEVTTAAKI
jgi:hypothetical protein